MAILSIAVVLALLIAANALYVAAEFAAVSAPRGRISALAEAGNARARRLEPVVERPAVLDRYIAVSQIGITVSSLLLGAYGQASLRPILEAAIGDLGGWEGAAAHSVAFGVVLVGLTVAQMVLGELVPKAIALQFPERTVLLTEPPMRFSLRVFAPLIWVLNGSGIALLRMVGLRHTGHRHVHSPGEIDYMLREGDGELDAVERRRLRRALWLSSRRARELMVMRHRIVALEIDTPLDEAIRIATEAPYTRFPVYREALEREDQIAGLLHTKDLVRAHMRGTATELSEILRPAVVAPLEASADELLALMRERRSAQALIVDGQGRIAGLVTLSDVFTELFGALADEFKSGPPGRGGERR